METADPKVALTPQKHDVVISGVSGKFPRSDSVKELQDNLFNKVDLVTDTPRWKVSNPEIPTRVGTINNLNKFDASFFGVHHKQANVMDPMCRILLEKAYEAIIDSGTNPEDLRNTNTGVFIGACFTETERSGVYDNDRVNEYGLVGCSRAMLANRISYWLGVTGPSYTVDSACSSSLYALEHAFRAIRDGHCDSAIVGGSNLCLHPNFSLLLSRLGVISPDGRCKSFDNRADGYARAEAIVVVFLQKAKDCRRAYAQIVHAKTNCDGYKDEGIVFPSGKMHQLLLQKFYEECSVPPRDVEFVEAHGTGTRVGDHEELSAIDAVFCNNRYKSLSIGTIKSNLGHAESASGLVAITKMCIAYSSGCIPPNLHYVTPREDVSALKQNRLSVVTDTTSWNRGFAAVNNYGFGGANAHVLLKNIVPNKENNGLPADDLPRLVCVSGRMESAVIRILDDLESRMVDVEYVRLLHAIHGHNIRGHVCSTECKAVPIARDVQYYSGVRRPVWFVYSGIGSQWAAMGSELMRIPVFAASIRKCHKILDTKGINLTAVITKTDPNIFANVLNSFIGISAIQIGLTDLLKAVGIHPDYIIGHSLGELGCAYVDGCLTLEQTILTAYYRGLACVKSNHIKGSMAAIGIGYEQLSSMCPSGVEVACHNGPDSCTISGPADIIKNFVVELNDSGIIAKEVPCSNIAYHSKYIAGAGSLLTKYLNKVITNPKPRSKKWFPTSIPQSKWNDPELALCSTDFFTNNMLNPVLFEETSRQIHDSAITIEIAPHGFLQTILRKSLKKEVFNVALTQKDAEDNVQVLLNALGQLYEAGLNPSLANLYPKVQFPVSQGTPMLSHLVEWDHSEDWYVMCYNLEEKMNLGGRTIKLCTTDEQSKYIMGHIVNGDNVYPAMGYLVLVWETFAMTMDESYTKVSVVFQNVYFQNIVNIPKDGNLEFFVTIQKVSGNFEVINNGILIVTGQIQANKRNDHSDSEAQAEITEKSIDLSAKDFYKELRLRGYQYSGLFRGVVGCNIQASRGIISWIDNWVTFMDCMTQLDILGRSRNLFVHARIDEIIVDVVKHKKYCSKMDSEKFIEVIVDRDIGSIRAGGIEIRGFYTTSVPKRPAFGIPVLEKNLFFPNSIMTAIDIADILRAYIQIIVENNKTYKFNTVELVDEEYKINELKPVIEKVGDVFNDLQLVQTTLTIISDDIVDMTKQIAVKCTRTCCESYINILIGVNILSKLSLLHQTMTFHSKCFFISREKHHPDTKKHADKYNIVCVHYTGNEYIVLFKTRVDPKHAKFVNIVSEDQNFHWIDKVKQHLEDGEKIVLYSQNEDCNGILGLLKCLRKEPGGDLVHGLLIADDSAPDFDPVLNFYKEELDKDLAFSVYENGCWGTYRHLLLDNKATIRANHAFVQIISSGDSSSVSWVEGPLTEHRRFKNSENILVHVCCAALNDRDLLVRPSQITTNNELQSDHCRNCFLGVEVAGLRNDGSRVMGIVDGKGISNLVEGNKQLFWPIPEKWSFEEAVTVPVAYTTAYYALVILGRIRHGEPILIHAGSGGVGQATINVALHYGCEVFTTVGTAEKRAFIKKLFPQLKDTNILDAQSTSFEDMVKKETKGGGVDIVLNTLKSDNLQTSIRCLGHRGRFIQIQTFDTEDTFQKPRSAKGISFLNVGSDFYNQESKQIKKELQDLVQNGIEKGVVNPLTRRVFDMSKIKIAFRYMEAHEGLEKVVIKIRENEPNHTTSNKIFIDVIPRYYCEENHVYIIVGGLGGFGLELADWLISRGARKLVLASRRGVVNGYQAFRLESWTCYGAKALISTDNVATESGCEAMMTTANAMGPVAAIFNLAVVLKDCIFQNQTAESFRVAYKPKVLITLHLDRLSRKLCPELRNFVTFSSVSCGRGNAGQTNYGFANSMMERICERRKKLGLPALVVQWGAIGDVGIVAEKHDEDVQLTLDGTLQQRISSCLETLDKFLKQDSVIVSSMVIAEKAKEAECKSIVDSVAHIMAIKNVKKVSQKMSLAELGLDSMMNIEVKHMLEREFGLKLSTRDIRALSFAKLAELSSEINAKSEPKVSGPGS